MKTSIKTYCLVFLSVFLFTCSSSDDNDDGDDNNSNTVTFLDITKEVIGGCTVETFDDDLGTLCTFTVFYQTNNADITISATVPGGCDQEINGSFGMSDNFIGDNIRFGATVIRYDGSDPDVYFGQSGTVRLVNTEAETSFSFEGVLYNMVAEIVTESIQGSAVCPL